MSTERLFPSLQSLQRSGGCGIKKKDREDHGIAEDGVAAQDETFRNAFLKHVGESDHPGASRYHSYHSYTYLLTRIPPSR